MTLKRKNKVLGAGIGVIMALTTLTPVTMADAQTSGSSLSHVTLTWYFPANSGPDNAKVFAAANKIIEKDINATVDFRPIDFGDYETKMNEIAASGQSYDIAWTSSWMFNYRQNADKGAFLPITDLLKKDAPDIARTVPSAYLKSTYVNGQLYTVPVYGTAGNQQGFEIQKRFVTKFHLNVKKIHTFSQIAPFLAEIKEHEKDIVPFGVNGSCFDPESYGDWELAYGTYHGSNPKITPIDELPQFRSYLNLMHSWYLKGYINQDAGTIQDFSQQELTGKYAVVWNVSMQPGQLASEKNNEGGNAVVFVPLTVPYFQGIDATENAISATSQNPDRALMLLNLVNTNSELYNLFNFGIKGKDYKVVGKNTVKTPPQSGWGGAGWVLAANMSGKGYVLQGQPTNLWKQDMKYNKSLSVPPFTGFNFDDSSVKNQIANMSNVDGTYDQPLMSGVEDPKVYLPKYIQAVKQAGEDQVIAAEQQQLNAWLKAQKKSK